MDIKGQKKIEPKVKAGLKSVVPSTIGGMLIVYLLGVFDLPPMPPELAIGLGSMLGGGVSFLISYLKI